MTPLPPAALPSVSYIAFGIFNWTIPNIIAWVSVIVLFLGFTLLRLPKIFESQENEQSKREKQ